MSQSDIYDFLKENEGEYFTIDQLAKELDAANNNIWRQVNQLNILDNIELKETGDKTYGKKRTKQIKIRIIIL